MYRPRAGSPPTALELRGIARWHGRCSDRSGAALTRGVVRAGLGAIRHRRAAMGIGARLAGRLGGRDGVAFGAALLFTFCMYASVVSIWPALEPVRPALVTSVAAAVALFGRRLMQGEPLGLDGWRGTA